MEAVELDVQRTRRDDARLDGQHRFTEREARAEAERQLLGGARQREQRHQEEIVVEERRSPPSWRPCASAAMRSDESTPAASTSAS